jgi:hypothetical protein
MVFNDQLALQKIWLFSNSGRALALPATDAAVLGTFRVYRIEGELLYAARLSHAATVDRLLR